MPILFMKTQTITCNSCGKDSARLFWDQRYNGYRGMCMLCEGNWPESWWLKMEKIFRGTWRNCQKISWNYSM